jgi:pimeloyl-ACP methyl ester carboxylesterase
MQDSWTHGYINTNGLQLHYVTQGEGPLMLMLHGFPEFWYSWRHQIPVFAQNFQVVALDLRGYNDSDKPESQSAYMMSEFIKDVEGVIRALGYRTCTLVAHDWGGAIAWNFADAYPDMVDKLIVLNFPHPAKFAEGLRTPKQLLRSSYIFWFQIPHWPELNLQKDNYAAIDAIFSGTAFNQAAFTVADIDAYKDAAAKPGALTAILNYYRNIFPQILFGKTWDILEVPTLIIWGEQDTALGKELTYGTEAYVKNLQIKYVSNSGHWVQQEQPETVTQLIREFL